MNDSFSVEGLFPVLPEMLLASSILVLVVAGAFLGNRRTRLISHVAVYCLVSTAAILLAAGWDRVSLFNGMFVMDPFAGFTKLLILTGMAAVMAMSVRYLYREQINRFEYPVLVMTASLGMLLMVSAGNMLSLYAGLELQSLCLYILAAFHRDMGRSAEAAIKYFVTGAIASGMLLFGISLVYGFAGSLDFDAIGNYLGQQDSINPPSVIALVFVVSGLAFKISAVPFHMWTPDVYHGAPVSATALFALTPKVAAMALLIRVLNEPFGNISDQWMQIIYLLSMLSMIWGAFASLVQENIKRLMAYSAIGHIGYVLMGIAAGTAEGVGAALLYLTIYMVMIAGTFAVILVTGRDNFTPEDIGDFAGLSRSGPFTAYALALMMFSMSGIPPLAGFIGKFAVFQAAIEEGLVLLAVTGIVTSVVSAFYYLRIVKVMFFDEVVETLEIVQSFSCRAVMLISSLFVLCFIVNPRPLISITREVASSLFSG